MVDKAENDENSEKDLDQDVEHKGSRFYRYMYIENFCGLIKRMTSK
jgi:hypothetical protein